MKRRLSLQSSLRASAVVLTAAALLTPAPTAVATPGAPTSARAASASVSFPDWRRVDGCEDVAYTYAVAADPAYPSSWILTLNGANTEGDGSFSDSIYSTESYPEPTTGQAAVDLCGYAEEPGLYTVTASLRYRNAAGDYVTEQQAPTTFTVSNPRSTTRLKVKRARGGKVVAKVASVVPSATGATASPNVGATVRVQYRYKKLWVNLRGAKGETDNKGEDRFKTRLPRRAVKFRAVVKDQEYVEGSTSSIVRLR